MKQEQLQIHRLLIRTKKNIGHDGTVSIEHTKRWKQRREKEK